jgi:hypothetical protein
MAAKGCPPTKPGCQPYRVWFPPRTAMSPMTVEGPSAKDTRRARASSPLSASITLARPRRWEGCTVTRLPACTLSRRDPRTSCPSAARAATAPRRGTGGNRGHREQHTASAAVMHKPRCTHPGSALELAACTAAEQGTSETQGRRGHRKRYKPKRPCHHKHADTAHVRMPPLPENSFSLVGVGGREELPSLPQQLLLSLSAIRSLRSCRLLTSSEPCSDRPLTSTAPPPPKAVPGYLPRPELALPLPSPGVGVTCCGVRPCWLVRGVVVSRRKANCGPGGGPSDPGTRLLAKLGPGPAVVKELLLRCVLHASDERVVCAGQTRHPRLRTAR